MNLRLSNNYYELINNNKCYYALLVIINNLNINQINLNGTIFIDKITDFPINFQKSLLSLINKIQFEFNENKCRIIVSANKNINYAVQYGSFNADLYDRLSILTINTHSLINRTEDIPDLCEFFINYFCETAGLNYKKISEDAMYKLQSYNWPGNITQLKNIIEWLLITYNHCKEEIINASMLIPDIFNDGAEDMIKIDEILPLKLKEAREIFEKYYLSIHLKRTGGSISKTAENIDMECKHAN